MSEGDIQLILHRLDKQDETLLRIHEEVRRTNGRVSALEIEEAKWKAKEEAAKTQRTIAATVISGGMLAAIIWFVSTAI